MRGASPEVEDDVMRDRTVANALPTADMPLRAVATDRACEREHTTSFHHARMSREPKFVHAHATLTPFFAGVDSL